MRPVLRLLNTRYGIALGLTVFLLVVISAFRGVAGSRTAPPMAPALEPSHTVSVEPSGGDDGTVDDLVAGEPGGLPSVSLAPAAEAEARTVATAFATTWVTHTGVSADQWRAAMARHATTTLMAKLRSTDPSRVPASAVTGTVTLVARDQALVGATLPLDSGRLRLRLVPGNGHWKVDSIDWERPS